MKKHNFIISIIIIAVSLSLLLVITIQLFPLIQELVENTSDESNTLQYMQSHGVQGVPILIGLAALQCIIMVIPTPAVGVLIGLCYGYIWGPLIFLTGCAIGNLIIFVSIRRLSGIMTLRKKHKKIHKEFISKERLEQMKHPEYVIFLCFLIPAMPNSAITYLFAESKISLIRYLIASVLGSIPSAIVYTVLGNHLSKGSYTAAIIIGVVIIVLTLILLIFRKRIKDIVLKRGK